MIDCQADGWGPTYCNETHQYGALEDKKHEGQAALFVSGARRKVCGIQASASNVFPIG